MAGSGRAAQMQLVEVEETSPARAAAPPSGSRPEPGPSSPEGDPPPRGRLRTGRWVLLGGALAAAVVASLVVVDARARDADRDHALATPGLLLPVDGPLRARWSAPAASGAGTVQVAGGTVAVVTTDGAGRAVTGYAAGTGEPRWRVEVEGGTSGFEDGGLTCPSTRYDDDLVLCTAATPDPLYVDEGDEVTPQTRVLAIDAATGREEGGWSQPGVLIGVQRVDDDLVLASTDEDGHTLVQRRAGRTGDVLWTYRSRGVIVSEFAQARSTMDASERTAVVRGVDVVAVRLRDGLVTPVGSRALAVAAAPFRDAFATWTPARGGTLHDEDGAATVELPTIPAPLAVDDGSSGELAVVSTGVDVRGIDVGSGAEVWRAVTTMRVRGVVAQTVLLGDGPRYAALDATDGRTLWWQERRSALPWTPLTDGSVVLAPGEDGAGGDAPGTLVARDLRDGGALWQTELPAGVRSLETVGGLVVGRTADGVVVLG
ncbi:PQQ-binding-like beta-propeller repeat protein [Cellulomonas sp. DKR-3]|uniref:PQQ-binding-like beta-propeller repeat protein n=1 Tax=Cellulomonas fulva TaxID=2835530 RepID=A0ABS5U033_9CELL|nr:PQQ-binding-like beta-propeller repeat protein [Cellulomonas fulva]MBT0994758.1 PQQ-binding-like beta-propeller repeat protein [Cellulomonas fulva]